MTRYVDGFVLPVPKANLDAYLQLAQAAGAVWKEHGALEYVECVAEDVKAGEVTSFPQAVKLQEGETVIFSWIVYESREHRDSVNEKAMKDPRMANLKPEDLPFDAKRLFWGGFSEIVRF
ncbi:Uncharacterized conserved protein YbaA, DUF1428 family [Microbulbifer donghaiensis]|uniref:Uncharacterized conserved protein YbaA, DUF1428 family n=1 Tax=Microbulbifer donghaiensis TaxID=494016 RepID=A0A1M5GKY3_9GAMM|nr:DUF1428 domain-containing protein [Microbulbifer donghaiensis]SHG04367.1 Uncharacterized conserved protein YbaA, DUF1428 family [Microbulbifer donghaiensis]